MKFIKPTTINTSGTLTRASTATFIGSDGFLQTAAIDVARTDHEQGTGTLLGPLVEQAATNSVLHSYAMDNAVWQAGTPGYTAAASTDITGIDGTTAGVVKFTKTSTSGSNKQFAGQVRDSVPAPTRRVASLWVYVPSFTGLSQWDFYAVWTTNITDSFTPLLDRKKSKVFNKWVRVASSQELTAMGSLVARCLRLYLGNETGATPTGFCFYAQYAQDEPGTVPSSVIPTTTAYVTRAADVLTSSFFSNAVNEAIAAYNAGTTYALGNQVTFANGIYESAANANTGNSPVAGETTAWWLYVGPLNAYAMFDQTVESQTSAPDALMVSFKLGQAVNSIALLNCAAATVRAVMTDPVEGVVYDRTATMSSTLGVTNFWRWLYTPIDKRRDIAFLDLPLYANATISLTISNPGTDAKCGVCVVGRQFDIGLADYGTSIGIEDYSKITQDPFGRRIVTKRGYAKRMNIPITVPRQQVDYVTRTLHDLRQIPVVWIASVAYEATIVYGPFKNFEHVITTYGLSRLQLEIQGLV
jgi:hypothetical protein